MDTLLSDNGGCFASELANVTSQMLGFKKIFSTTYHPQSNSMIERVHSYIKQGIAMAGVPRDLNYHSGADWTALLPAIAFSYNNAVNRMLGFAPHELMFGTILSLPVDVQTVQALTEVQLKKHWNDEFAVAFYGRLQKQLRLVTDEAIKNQEVYDRRRLKSGNQKRKEARVYSRGQRVYRYIA